MRFSCYSRLRFQQLVAQFPSRRLVAKQVACLEAGSRQTGLLQLLEMAHRQPAQ